MPTRVLRDWTDSYKVNDLDWPAEVFFTRLIMKVDDYGRFTGDSRLLRSALFPLKDGIRDTDISRWIAMCEKAGLIRVYQATDKPFILIEKFNQRVRAEKSKYPEPSGEVQADVGQLPGMCQTDVRQPRTKAETESKTKEESKNSPKEKREEKERPTVQESGSCRLPPQSAYVSEPPKTPPGPSVLSENLKSSYQGKEGGNTGNLEEKHKSGKLYRVWITSGKTAEEYEKKTNPPLPELNEDDMHCLELARVDMDKKTLNYYRRAKALLGEGVFSTICHEVKNLRQEGVKAKLNESARFIFKLEKAVSK